MSGTSELLQYQKLIKSVIMNVAGHALDQSDILDIVQETNLKVLTNVFDPSRGSMQAWVSTIAHNQAVSALRRVSRHATPNSDAIEAAEQGGSDSDDSEVYVGDIDMSDPSQEDVLAILAREQRMTKVQKILESLDPDDQHFLLISMRDDYSNEEYAKKLGVTPVALRVRKFRLGAKIRDLLAKLDS